MTISCEDIQRIALEVMISTEREQDRIGEDHRIQADAWAESVGMEEGCMAMICNGITEAFARAMTTIAAEQVERDEGTVEVDGVEAVALDSTAFEWGVEMTVISAFRWGFETARQYTLQTKVSE